MAGKKYKYQKRKSGFVRQVVIFLPAVILVVMLAQTAFAKTYAFTDGGRSIPDTAQEGETGDGWMQTVHIRYHGETLEVPASGETVGELLHRLHLEVEEGDVLSHSPDAAVYNGMTLFVDAVFVRRETYTATVSHEVIVCNDASIPAGSEEVLIPGEDGELLCTADVTYVNGMEQERKVRSQTMTLVPVTEIVAVGTGEAVSAVEPGAMPEIGDGYITLPTGEVLTYTDTVTVRATAYTHTDAGCDMITATGSTVHVGTVAVDPRYIPYGTRMFIVANDGSYIYGVSEAEDCGGAIKGDRVDLYFPTYAECMAFGWRVCTIYLLGQE